MERRLRWGQAVVHVFDQGFASAFWLGVLLAFGLRFVLGFRGDYQLVDAPGNQSFAIGKRGWSERLIWDSRHARWVHASVLALPVTHPNHRDTPLWLVVCRRKGRTPWSLLTAEPIVAAEDAWRVVAGLCAQVANRTEWALEQKRVGFPEPASVALAGAPEAVGSGELGLRLSLAAAGTTL